MKRNKRTTLLILAAGAVCVLLVFLCGNLLRKPQDSSPDDPSASIDTQTAETASILNNYQWWQKTIAYEIYVRSFKDSNGDGIGDLNGITSELDHLKSLGVGVIWLTPCYVSPQADNGYDVADYYNIDPVYGTMADMENLIAEAGKRDIRIVRIWYSTIPRMKMNGSGHPEVGKTTKKVTGISGGIRRKTAVHRRTGAVSSAVLHGNMMKPETSTICIPF